MTLRSSFDIFTNLFGSCKIFGFFYHFFVVSHLNAGKNIIYFILYPEHVIKLLGYFQGVTRLDLCLIKILSFNLF